MLISGYALFWDEVDLGKDVAEAGCCDQSLMAWNSRGQPIPMLLEHQPWRRVGDWTHFEVDAWGLYLWGRLYPTLANRWFVQPRIRSGDLRGLSIGHRTISATPWSGLRYLHQIELHEVSLVTNPMQPEAILHEIEGLQRAA